MQPGAVSGASLDGMAEGVAEVEQRASARFPLVGAYDRRLELAAPPHGIRERRAITRHELFHVAFQPARKGFVQRNTVLDDLGQAGTQLAVRQRVERGD